MHFVPYIYIGANLITIFSGKILLYLRFLFFALVPNGMYTACRYGSPVLLCCENLGDGHVIEKMKKTCEFHRPDNVVVRAQALELHRQGLNLTFTTY